VFLLGWTVKAWTEAGRDRQDIARLEAEIGERDSERAKAQAFLDLASNRSTRDQSQFLNGLIQRKAFSWTRVFEDLEQVMPQNLHVVSLRPELSDENQMKLEMKVVGDSRSAAIDLVHRMEGSKHFRDAQLLSESEFGDAGSLVLASVISTYVPDSADRSGK
jgi:type IV pilus assembly protein PilN